MPNIEGAVAAAAGQAVAVAAQVVAVAAVQDHQVVAAITVVVFQDHQAAAKVLVSHGLHIMAVVFPADLQLHHHVDLVATVMFRVASQVLHLNAVTATGKAV